MADENEIEEEKKSSIVPIVIAVILSLLVGAGGTYFLTGGDSSSSDEEAAKEQTSSVEAADATGKGLTGPCITPLGTFNVNLKDPTGARKLQMDISVESKCDAPEKELGTKQAELQSSIILLASEYTVTMLDGMNGKMALKDEIQLRINKIVEPHQISRVYFTKFIIN
ncbi:MAG: hypothetical protein CMK59_13610 [Proteobacteria bacterium]|nr:hypothetical protein [Pseudomonadota bacterium]